MTGPWYVDTNVVLRYLLNDHETLSPRAREFWESVRVGQVSAILTEGVLMVREHRGLGRVFPFDQGVSRSLA